MKGPKGWIVKMLAGTLMLAAPAFAAPRGGGGYSRGDGGSSRGAGSEHTGSAAQHFSGGGAGRSFSAPTRGFSVGERDFDRDDHRGGFDRGHARGGGWGVGIGVGAYPSYVDPYYAAPPYYGAPVPAPVCIPSGGYYDAYGNWIPDPNCQVPPVAYPTPYRY